MQKPPYDPVPDDRNALLQATEQTDDAPLRQSIHDQSLATAMPPTSPSLPEDGDGEDNDVGHVDQNGQLGTDKKAKENVYVWHLESPLK